jgi:galactarate dehydratase
VARRDIARGEAVPEVSVTSLSNIPFGHKIALRDIPKGDLVKKYGQVIGVASAPIAGGEHVHVHNLEMLDVDLKHDFSAGAFASETVSPDTSRHFLGYQRSSGKVGTRNYVAIISSVNCSATVCRMVADHFKNPEIMNRYENVDGVVAFTHGSGCSSNGYAQGYSYLTRTLTGYAQNPNVGGAVFIGLGCETNQISLMMEEHHLAAGPRLKMLNTQNSGGTRKTLETAIGAVEEMLELVNADKRTAQPLSELVVALQCGGSDAYSGISANPALGYASDLLVKHGGTAVLSETPEIYGAEHLLTRRAVSADVARELLTRIDWWRQYTERNGAELNNNPSHGNKAGGLTTILEKSLGAVAKGGTTQLNAVYEFAEPIVEKGLVFMDTPGNDPVAVTGQVAGGANLICFTTGRGSTSGFKPAPCIKIASNTPMYENMVEDIDVNCGTIVSGDESIEQAGTRIFEMLLSVASGSKSKSEEFGYGDNEFVPWVVGAVM